MPSLKIRRDSKRRVLHTGESVRANGKYQFKYVVNGKPKFLYSWRGQLAAYPVRSAACRQTAVSIPPGA